MGNAHSHSKKRKPGHGETQEQKGKNQDPSVTGYGGAPLVAQGLFYASAVQAGLYAPPPNGIYPVLAPPYHAPQVPATTSARASAPPLSYFYAQEALDSNQILTVMAKVRHRGRDVPYCLILEVQNSDQQEIAKSFKNVFGHLACVDDCGIFFDPIAPFCCLWTANNKCQLMFYFNQHFSELEVGQLLLHFLEPLRLQMRPVERGDFQFSEMKPHTDYPLLDNSLSIPRTSFQACVENFKRRVDAIKRARMITTENTFIKLSPNTPTVSLKTAGTVHLDTGSAGFTSTSTPGF